MKQANRQATDPPAMHRRKLLGAAGTTGALAAATLLATRQAEPDAAGQAEAAVAPQKRGGGYRLSEHVMRYYQTTKV
jgi:hypothetical protein